MPCRLRFGAALALLLVSVCGEARSPELSIATQVSAAALPVGTRSLGEGALVHRPRNLGDGPAPLLVLFHGAGMSARQMIDGLAGEAERCGCLLLAVKSAGATWDLIEARRQASRAGPRVRLSSLFGDDAGRVERALSAVLAWPVADRRRVAMVGFSDGASYALSLGLANPGLVRGVVAIAPGFHVEPAAIDPGQRLFIAHSPDDRVLSFANSRDGIFRSLQRAGFDVTFRSFGGGHALDAATLREGIAHLLGPISPAGP